MSDYWQGLLEYEKKDTNMNNKEAKKVAIELMRKEIAKLLLRHDELVEAILKLKKEDEYE